MAGIAVAVKRANPRCESAAAVEISHGARRGWSLCCCLSKDYCTSASEFSSTRLNVLPIPNLLSTAQPTHVSE